MAEMEWFGRSWRAPINELHQVEVPVGEPCLHCARSIEAGDSGVVLTAVDVLPDSDPPAARFQRRPAHLMCFLANTLGHRAAAALYGQLLERMADA